MTENEKPENPTAQSPEDHQYALDRKRYTVEKITLFFLFLYVTIAAFQWCEMRKSVEIAHHTFVAANKPSVGVNSFSVWHSAMNTAGRVIKSPTPTKSTQQLDVRVEIKNFGPVAADNFVPTYKVFLGGVEEEITSLGEDRPSTIFPGKTIYLGGSIGTRDYPAVMNSEKVLEMEITVSYDGPNQRYTYCEKDRYDPKANLIFGLGAACKK